MTENIYNTPESNLGREKHIDSGKGKWLALLGAFVMLLLPIELFTAYMDIYSLFYSIHESGDPTAVAGAMSERFIRLYLGCFIPLIGFISVAFSILFMGYKSKWLYLVCWFHAVMLLFLIPLGTVVSIVCGVYLWIKRCDF